MSAASRRRRGDSLLVGLGAVTLQRSPALTRWRGWPPVIIVGLGTAAFVLWSLTYLRRPLMPEVVMPAFLLPVAGLHRLSLLSTTTQPQEEFMKPVTQINFLSIKPGKIGAFIEAERSYAASTNLPAGLIGSRMYHSLDGKSVVRVSQYESIEAHKEVHQDEALRQHIDRLSPLFESSNPALYEEVYTTGDFK